MVDIMYISSATAIIILKRVGAHSAPFRVDGVDPLGNVLLTWEDGKIRVIPEHSITKEDREIYELLDASINDYFDFDLVEKKLIELDSPQL